MAQPTQPTSTTIATEALTKAGYSNPSTARITRAWNYWGQEIKNDIWMKVRELKMLQSEAVIALIEGQSRYSAPTDYSSYLSAVLLDGINYGVCQAGGSTTTVKLASSINVSAEYMRGKEIMVYLTSTPATAYIAQCTAFNESTKLATVNPAWTPSPDATYSYLVVDEYRKLDESAIWDYDGEVYPTEQREPTNIHPIGDTDYSEFILRPVPDDAYYGLRFRYYANLMTLDESSTLHGTLLYRWRNIFLEGITAKQLMDDDDNRALAKMASYYNMLNSLTLREEYGTDLSNLQATVSD